MGAPVGRSVSGWSCCDPLDLEDHLGVQNFSGGDNQKSTQYDKPKYRDIPLIIPCFYS